MRACDLEDGLLDGNDTVKVAAAVVRCGTEDGGSAGKSLLDFKCYEYQLCCRQNHLKY
jgi:hypothetical protein